MYQGKFSQNAPVPMPKATPKKKKRQPSLGSTIFYTLYFLFIILFCAGTAFGLRWLNGWLRDYEASQPTAKAVAAFNQLFGKPDWKALYASAGIEDSLYENAETFQSYMDERTAGQNFTYGEISSGLSGSKTYHVRLGEEVIGAFTLEDHNTDSSQFAIPDWQLGKVELFIDRDLSCRIVKQDGHTAKVNGVPLEESDTLQIATTVAEEYLPAGVTAPRTCTQAVEGLFHAPQVQIFDKDGNEIEVAYQEESRTFLDATLAPEVPEDLKAVALSASQYYALWMAGEADSEATLKTHFLEGTDTYQAIIRTGADPLPQGSSHEFKDVSVTDYVRYDEKHFSLRVEMDLSVTQSGGASEDRSYRKSMIFQKQANGSWLCILCVNLDLSQPVGRVRLTFLHEDIPVSSDFFHTESKEIITPVINAPEGKVFAGWEDEYGTLVFRPDITGRAAVSPGQYLTPMTLYARFETLG